MVATKRRKRNAVVEKCSLVIAHDHEWRFTGHEMSKTYLLVQEYWPTLASCIYSLFSSTFIFVWKKKGRNFVKTCPNVIRGKKCVISVARKFQNSSKQSIVPFLSSSSKIILFNTIIKLGFLSFCFAFPQIAFFFASQTIWENMTWNQWHSSQKKKRLFGARQTSAVRWCLWCYIYQCPILSV